MIQILAKDYQYREVANLFDAVKQFMSHFDKYSHIPAIADLQSRVDTIRSDLTIHVRKTFREVAQVELYTRHGHKCTSLSYISTVCMCDELTSLQVYVLYVCVYI